MRERDFRGLRDGRPVCQSHSAVPNRRALRVVLALRADHLDDLLFQQLGQHPEPDPDAQGEQAFPRVR
jgi:hypothetical protein